MTSGICLLCLILLGYTIFQESLFEYKDDHFVHQDASYFVGVVSDEPTVKNSTRSIVHVSHCGKSTTTLQPCEGKILTYIMHGDSLSNLRLGDKIQFTGSPSDIQKNKNPYNFDYPKFLYHKGIHKQIFIRSHEWKVIQKDHTPAWKKYSVQLRKKCIQTFQKYIHNEEELGIALALCLGFKSLASKEILEAFSDTGAMHVLAVSGLHVGILSVLISKFLLLFIRSNKLSSRISRGIISLFFIWTFAFVTGCAPAVLRASLMFSFYFVGQTFSKPFNSYNIVYVSAILLLLYDPHLLFTVSFQFSYLALLSIIFFFPKIKAFISPNNKILKALWDTTAMGIAAQVFIFPLSLYYFHKFSFAFILSGAASLLFAGFILKFGLILLIIECWQTAHIVNEIAIGKILNFLLSFFKLSIETIQRLPFSHIDNVHIASFNLLMLYACIIAFSAMLVFHKRWLYIALCFLFIQVLESTHRYYIDDTQEVFCVYHVKKGSYVEYLKGREYATLMNPNLDKNDLAYINQGIHIRYNIKDSVDINTSTLKDSQINRKVLINQSSFVLLGSIDENKYSLIQSPDIILCNYENYKDQIWKYADSTSLVIIDGSIYANKRIELMVELDLCGIKYHDTYTDGAFIQAI